VTAQVESASYLRVAIAAARAAGEAILLGLGGSRRPRFKGFRDIVTDTDLRAEGAIVEVIRAQYPNHAIYSEEGGAAGNGDAHTRGTELQWFVDPLDGTTNFAHAFPVFCTSLALRNGQDTLVGVVYDPLHEQMFTAQSGQGAWLNDKRLQVSDCKTLEDSLVALDWGRDPLVRDRTLAMVGAMAPRVATLRTLGSAVLALCGVAAGHLEAYFNLALYDWDVAAADLFVREAGGCATDLKGDPWQPGVRGCLVSNGHLHSKLLDVVRGA
jgi:myo-inositol-1(or 4)-monophosphatase